MKIHPWLGRSAALLCLAATLHFNCARAQDPPKAAETRPTAQAAAKAGSALAYDLVIEQGLVECTNHVGFGAEATLANVVGVLREIWPEANIVLAPEVSSIKVADLKLHSTHELGEALEALRVASGYRFDWRKGLPNAASPTDPATGLPSSPAGGESPLYVLDLGINSQGNPLERARRMVEVFNLSGYLDHLPSQDPSEVNRTLVEIQNTVIETLEGLRGDGLSENDQSHGVSVWGGGSSGIAIRGGNLSLNDQSRFRFHPGTRLLIVTGPPDSIEVARKVVTALTGQPSGGESVLLGDEQDAKQRAAQEAIHRRYGLRPPEGRPPGQPGVSFTNRTKATVRPPAQAGPNVPPAGSTFTDRIKSIRKDGQAGPDDPSSAPANPEPPPR